MAPNAEASEAQARPRDTANPALSDNGVELSIVMPSLNEAETLEVCIQKALGFLEREGVVGEIVVADNGSTDGSQDIARNAGARVVDVPMRGYGAALQGGIAAAKGKYVIMGDSDDSYDFSALRPFVERLRAGDELVMGNRFRGGIKPGAMPNLHKYVGNPFFTQLGRVLFSAPIRDSQCGLRGFSRQAILDVGLKCTGMEFASEMVVKSTLHGLKIGEVPTTLSPDGRSRPPHLRSWRDGSRILRFHLLHSPRWTYFIPGLILLAAGFLLFGLKVESAVTPRGAHVLFAAAGLTLVGVQAILFGHLARKFSYAQGVLPRPEGASEEPERGLIERGLVLGILFAVAGLAVIGYSVAAPTSADISAELGAYVDWSSLKMFALGGTSALVGLQLVLANFMGGLIDLARD